MSETQQTVRVAMRLATLIIAIVTIAATSCGINRDSKKAMLLTNKVPAPGVACVFEEMNRGNETLCALQTK